MTSQIVFIVVIAIVAMQLYFFFKTNQILDLFNTIVSGFVGAYLQRDLNQVPKLTASEPTSIKDNDSKPLLHDNNIQDVG